MKICSKFTGEHQSRSAISIKFHNNFTEIALRHGCSPVDLLHIFRKPFPRNTSGWLPLNISKLYLHFTLLSYQISITNKVCRKIPMVQVFVPKVAIKNVELGPWMDDFRKSFNYLTNLYSRYIHMRCYHGFSNCFH